MGFNTLCVYRADFIHGFRQTYKNKPITTEKGGAERPILVLINLVFKNKRKDFKHETFLLLLYFLFLERENFRHLK